MTLQTKMPSIMSDFLFVADLPVEKHDKSVLAAVKALKVFSHCVTHGKGRQHCCFLLFCIPGESCLMF